MVVVVIPIHKSDPSENELRSFVQCYKVLGEHPIKVIAPEGLDLKKYQDRVKSFDTVFLEGCRFWGVKEYNKLKVSPFFYKLFAEYEYMLTYELDAWVFQDELEYWCSRGFDFIGAPWFEGYTVLVSDNIIPGANSGFSLRNISSSLRIIKRVERIRSLRNFFYKSKLQSIIRFEKILYRLRKYFHIKSVQYLEKLVLEHWEPNEDYFFSRLTPSVFKDFNVAPYSESVKFSFEVNAAFLYKQNNERLPFGCHAWERYEPDFWEEHIID